MLFALVAVTVGVVVLLGIGLVVYAWFDQE